MTEKERKHRILEALEREFDPAMAAATTQMSCQIEAVPGLVCEGQAITRMDEVVRADLNEYRERAVFTYTAQRRQ